MNTREDRKQRLQDAVDACVNEFNHGNVLELVFASSAALQQGMWLSASEIATIIESVLGKQIPCKGCGFEAVEGDLDGLCDDCRNIIMASAIRNNSTYAIERDRLLAGEIDTSIIEED